MTTKDVPAEAAADVPADLPADVARLWRLPAGHQGMTGRRGRPAELTVDRVVGAAVALAEDLGLAGVTLPKVAEALHVTPMSLYRYIGSKDELFVLMEDLGWGPAPRLRITRGRWRSGLERWALAQQRVLREHPWLAHVPIGGPPRGPHLIGWMDVGLRALRDTGLDWASRLGALTVVSGYVRHSELMAQQLAAGRKAAGVDHQEQVEHAYGRDLARLVDADRCPDAAALFRSGLFEPSGGEPAADAGGEEFAFGLSVVLDGIAATIARTTA
ncbi:regulatory protein, tetR family [Actinopolymorpha cephalotaxi]|uniref:AcrR family transcriptional regulator n=1 Tax=Actinopolymorpha cephalotaxi TaxID=504797 RepID=A0A1I2XA51_9ACTN|nr:TetR/AcrR family transcriptional regulator [Actinopolymorpha cephalotaxi]NYH86136.1 AcrR family transcriptional regulator [Actinopolymorpha cephalotaxi]SFH10282.1 regulatory protein, tetR family [Actinopolymorpha cephalotaxi]